MQASTPPRRSMKKALQRRFGLPDALFAALWEYLEGDVITSPESANGRDNAEVWQCLLDKAETNRAFRDVKVMRNSKGSGKNTHSQDDETAQAMNVRRLDCELALHQKRCAQAINAYYVSRARDDKALISFRERELGGRHLGADEAATWLEVNHDGGASEELQRIGRSLMRDFGWRRLEEVMWFVLTDHPPAPFAIEVSIASHAMNDPAEVFPDYVPWENFRRRAEANDDGSQTSANQQHFFVRSTVTITVAPWLSKEKVAEAYDQAQSDTGWRIGLRQARRLSERSLAVFEFVIKERGYRGKGAASLTIVKDWNREHEQWQYNDRTDFYDAYVAVKKALILPLRAKTKRADGIPPDAYGIRPGVDGVVRMSLNDSHADSQEG